MAGRKLKVFQAQFGFYDTVVAATSRAAALRAWGTRQDLFANGDAVETTDEAAIAAASAHPQTPLRRAVGSTDPFALEPANLPKVPDAPKKTTAKSSAQPKPVTPARPRPNRSKLDAAEKALGAINERREREETAFRLETDDLQQRQAAAQSAYVKAREEAASKVVVARTAYEKAGGLD